MNNTNTSTSGKSFRIGIDARMFRSATGGIGRYSRELIKNLAEIDKTNQYFVFLTEQDMLEWTVDQPNFTPVLVDALHYSKLEQTKFLSTLYKYSLDLVHYLNFNHPILYLKPFVTTLHDLTLWHSPIGKSQSSLLRRSVFKSIFRHAMAGSRKVIAISEYSASDAVKTLQISHAKMEVIYEGGPEVMNPEFGSKAETQKYLGTRDPYFLFVSQWRPHKGILTLIDAFNQFKTKTGASTKLVLVGNQKVMLESVKKAVVESPFVEDIITPGFVPDDVLQNLYHFGQALIMPSEYEGFGLPILEAFARGIPVIAANNTSLPELVGDAGLLFETRNSVDLAGCMERISTNPELATNLVEKGFKQLKKFSWRKMAQETRSVYMSVLEKIN